MRNRSSSNPGTPAEGGLEFELTDFSDARRALDEPPAGLEVARKLRPSAWDSKRRPPLPTDHAMGGRAVDWILSLPSDIRPLHLADKVPRIANELAEHWPDADRAAAFVNDLLVDRRGGRRGFPPEIKRELVVLLLTLRRNRSGNRA